MAALQVALLPYDTFDEFCGAISCSQPVCPLGQQVLKGLRSNELNAMRVYPALILTWSMSYCCEIAPSGRVSCNRPQASTLICWRRPLRPASHLNAALDQWETLDQWMPLVMMLTLVRLLWHRPSDLPRPPLVSAQSRWARSGQKACRPSRARAPSPPRLF